MQVIEKIDLNGTCPTHTLAGIKAREPDFDLWELRNDMIEKVAIYCCDYGFLSLGIDYKSGKQGVGYGYRSEGNIGLMICQLARMLGVGNINGDILAALKGMPIRVLFKKDFGGSVADSTYIGHFMEDKFMKMSDLVKTGIVEKDGK